MVDFRYHSKTVGDLGRWPLTCGNVVSARSTRYHERPENHALGHAPDGRPCPPSCPRALVTVRTQRPSETTRARHPALGTGYPALVLRPGRRAFSRPFRVVRHRQRAAAGGARRTEMRGGRVEIFATTGPMLFSAARAIAGRSTPMSMFSQVVSPRSIKSSFGRRRSCRAVRRATGSGRPCRRGWRSCSASGLPVPGCSPR